MFHRFTFSRCIRVFLATFVLACLFQFILIGLFGAFPNKFDFYHAIVQKQKIYLPIQPTIYRTNEQLVSNYFKIKEDELRSLEEERKSMEKYYQAKAIKNNVTLIQNFNWSLDNMPYFFRQKNTLYPSEDDPTYSNLAIWPDGEISKSYLIKKF